MMNHDKFPIVRRFFMSSRTREKFATQVDSDTLAKIRALAEEEGRQIQALMDEALTDLLEKRRQENPRSHAMAAYRASHAKFGALYKKLSE